MIIEDFEFDAIHPEVLTAMFGSSDLPHFFQMSGEPRAHRCLMCAAERVKRGLGEEGCHLSLLQVLRVFEARLADEQSHMKAADAAGADAPFSSYDICSAAINGGG